MSYSGTIMIRVCGAIAALVFVSAFPATGKDEGDSKGPLEVTSLLGRKLYGLPDDGSIRAAQQKLAADRHNISLVLQLSKAQAGRRQYREAVATSTAGLAFAPDNAELYLERGHRELGLRQFAAALTDLDRAVKINPKQLDEFYHQGLAHYFQGQFGEAARSFRNALDLAQTSDSVIDCSNWLYVSLRRAGRNEEAAQALTRITPETKNQEPHLLFYLRLLRFYQGAMTEQEILPAKPTDPNDLEGELAFDTTSYGVGNWHLYHNDAKRARELFRPVVTGYAWNAWGFIGSEIELAKSNSNRK
jgi:tetratricopeptide (TPR) repeat protein